MQMTEAAHESNNDHWSDECRAGIIVGRISISRLAASPPCAARAHLVVAGARAIHHAAHSAAGVANCRRFDSQIVKHHPGPCVSRSCSQIFATDSKLLWKSSRRQKYAATQLVRPNDPPLTQQRICSAVGCRGRNNLDRWICPLDYRRDMADCGVPTEIEICGAGFIRDSGYVSTPRATVSTA